MNKHPFKKLVFILVVLFLLPVFAHAETIAVSFYPLYALTVNLTNGIDTLNTAVLASPSTGCLHDYQLTTGDMKTLDQSDAFVICGAGMESYLAHVYDAFPALPVITASTGLPLLDEEGHLLSPEEAERAIASDEEINAHVWLDVSNAIVMVNTICDELSRLMPQYADALAANRDVYTVRLAALDSEIREGLAQVSHRTIVTFHEAFPYFASAYGLEIAAVVAVEPGDSLSPAALSRLIRTVKSLNNPPLFTEPQYSSLAAETVAAETGASIWVLDPVVTGPRQLPEVLTAYEDIMRENLHTLQQALQ